MIKVRSRYNKKNFDKLASAANDILGVSGTAVVDVDFVSEENIHELNKRTRGVDRATDVLSYPFLDDASMPMDEEHYPEDYELQAARGAARLHGDMPRIHKKSRGRRQNGVYF